MFSANRTVWAVSLAVLMGFGLSFLNGCGGGVEYEGDERAAIVGTVTLDGSPLPFGIITFVPAGQGRRASGNINDGSYSIPEEWGPNLGEYKVEIIGSPKPSEEDEEEEEESGDDDDDEDGGGRGRPGEKPMVAPQYNTETTLTATIVAGENTCDFKVTSD